MTLRQHCVNMAKVLDHLDNETTKKVIDIEIESVELLPDGRVLFKTK